jgi:hypothetical protein
MQHRPIWIFAGKTFRMDLCLIVMRQLDSDTPAYLTFYRLNRIEIGCPDQDGILPVNVKGGYTAVEAVIGFMPESGELGKEIPLGLAAVQVSHNVRLLISKESFSAAGLVIDLDAGRCEQAWLTSWNNSQRYITDSLIRLGLKANHTAKPGEVIYKKFGEPYIPMRPVSEMSILTILSKYGV